jgi:subtilisin family serine protease
MNRQTYNLHKKASISLASILNRQRTGVRPLALARAAGFLGEDPEKIEKTDPIALLVKARNSDAVLKALEDVPSKHVTEMERLSEKFISVKAGAAAVEALIANKLVERVQTKKESRPFLEAVRPAIGLLNPGGTRVVPEDGTGVLIGIVDSGFDLSHPMFRDEAGKLRVEGLLEQRGGKPSRAFTNAQLEQRWASGSGPGADENGHGTHVASIAGGSKFGDLEGIAPGARYLLVKTDFINTADGVKWIFDKAGSTPCVINMSLGHHFGAHDGTDLEEQLHVSLSEPGRAICIAAGNEQIDQMHIGGGFHEGQIQEVGFDILMPRDGSLPIAPMTLWYDQQDTFELSLITPGGQELPVPKIGKANRLQGGTMEMQLARELYPPSKLVQTEITIEFTGPPANIRLLREWRLRLRCVDAVIGRLDGWFVNSGFGVFGPHLLVETARTIGLAATGEGCIAVACHASKNRWRADDGDERDTRAVSGRTSFFSSRGPTRDGRSKPEISAPGQLVTAALAKNSEETQRTDRALVNDRLLTIEGTSMACPAITGIVALLLQKKPTLTVSEVRDVLRRSARHDQQTGAGVWNPSYGFGKVDVAAALALV